MNSLNVRFSGRFFFLTNNQILKTQVLFNMKLDKLKCELKWEDFFEESLDWFKICEAHASLKSKQFHWKMLHRVTDT